MNFRLSFYFAGNSFVLRRLISASSWTRNLTVLHVVSGLDLSDKNVLS